MLVTNGTVFRNVAEKQLPYYQAKGYTEVKAKAKTSTKPKTDEKGKE